MILVCVSSREDSSHDDARAGDTRRDPAERLSDVATRRAGGDEARPHGSELPRSQRV